MGRVRRDEKETLKQIITYADGITAFSALQSIGFVLSAGINKDLAQHVKDQVSTTCAAIGFSSLVYCGLIFLCHRSETSLAEEEPKNSPLRRVTRTIHGVRYGIIIISTILASGFVLSTLLPSNVGKDPCRIYMELVAPSGS